MTATPMTWGIGTALVVGGLLYLLSPILTPFLAAALLAYIASPLLTHMERARIPRTLAVSIVFLVLLLLLLILLLVLIPQIQQQIVAFAGKLPGYFDRLNDEWVPWLQRTLGVDASGLDLASLKTQVTKHWEGLGGNVGRIFSYMTRSGMQIMAMLVNLALIPVVTFYLMRDWDGILARVPGMFPPRMRAPLLAIARETDEVLAGFLRGQLSVMLALALVYSVGLGIVGLDLALAIGLLAGLVSFVPYLGFIVGILAAGVAALLQFHDAIALLKVAAVFGVGQILESSVLTPYLVGGRIGLHPVAVIFAVLAGGQLFGFFGILLALPVAAAVKVWMRHLYRGYQLSTFYKQPGKRARRP